jgi:hypothetical protein
MKRKKNKRNLRFLLETFILELERKRRKKKKRKNNKKTWEKKVLFLFSPI